MAAIPSEEELLRKALFVPCNSKEALHRWIKVYLGVDMPDCLVDPSSTASSMDVIWEIYSVVRNRTPGFTQTLAFSSRDSFKTLSASIVEVLMLAHLEWNVAHMAAILPQAKKSQQYVKKFFNRPFLREFVTSTNERMVEITRYRHRKTGEFLSPKEFETAVDKAGYEELKNYISIVVATLQGANSEHVPFMCVDEVDVVENPDAYEEAKFIPAPFQGQPPITLLTSTRKFSFGLVQKEIDNAHDTGLHIRHWNIIDVTEACPPERHLPEEPKVTIYRSDDTLRAIPEKDYQALSPEDQAKYTQNEGYAGCLKNCKLFAVCKGRLATEQKSRSPLLKPIDHVIGQFRKVSINKAKAQLMCWKPSTEGLIYPNFERDVHMLTASQMAEKLTGMTFPANFSKVELLDLMLKREVLFYSGLDHGYTHNFATVTAALDGKRLFVIDVISQPELELSQKIEALERIKHLNPSIFPDPEDPASNKTLARHFRVKNFHKEKGSVIGGIEIVRMKLMPGMSQPELFFLKGDLGVELLCKRISQYHWELDAAGRPTDVPDDEDDDEVDALRYLCMNLFSPKGKFGMVRDEKPVTPTAADAHNYTQENWAQKIISEQIGSSPQSESSSAAGKRGGFMWDV